MPFQRSHQNVNYPKSNTCNPCKQNDTIMRNTSGLILEPNTQYLHINNLICHFGDVLHVNINSYLNVLLITSSNTSYIQIIQHRNNIHSTKKIKIIHFLKNSKSTRARLGNETSIKTTR